MPLFSDTHQSELREAGWHSRGYLPHFDGRAMPQFITFHLSDSLPEKVLQRWQEELKSLSYKQERIILQRRIERYLDQGYGEAFLKVPEVARMVQNSPLKFDGSRYHLYSWVVIPNHVHCLMTRFQEYEVSDILHSIKSFTAHEANKILNRGGQVWIEEYFDR
jgi:REP element-mobilizing transposase RayT